ncbi:hypothetical protein J0J37_22745, partial [Vibrio vulnificus]
MDEVSVLLRISHPNLVGLMGFCLEKGNILHNISWLHVSENDEVNILYCAWCRRATSIAGICSEQELVRQD